MAFGLILSPLAQNPSVLSGDNGQKDNENLSENALVACVK